MHSCERRNSASVLAGTTGIHVNWTKWRKKHTHKIGKKMMYICEMYVNARENPLKIIRLWVWVYKYDGSRTREKCKALKTTAKLQVQIDFYCTTFQLQFQLIMSEMKRELRIHNGKEWLDASPQGANRKLCFLFLSLLLLLCIANSMYSTLCACYFNWMDFCWMKIPFEI